MIPSAVCHVSRAKQLAIEAYRCVRTTGACAGLCVDGRIQLLYQFSLLAPGCIESVVLRLAAKVAQAVRRLCLAADVQNAPVTVSGRAFD